MVYQWFEQFGEVYRRDWKKLTPKYQTIHKDDLSLWLYVSLLEDKLPVDYFTNTLMEAGSINTEIY
jgi:hypothetical protein